MFTEGEDPGEMANTHAEKHLRGEGAGHPHPDLSGRRWNLQLGGGTGPREGREGTQGAAATGPPLRLRSEGE